MIYLYNYGGEPWKTQYWIRQVMNKLYHATPDGYCGDEDNGQTSAWYVFSAMGFYPVCPGTTQYVFGTPLFRKMTLSFENGKKLVIQAPATDKNTFYIHNISLNGTAHTKIWIDHSQLQKGGTLLYDVKKAPSYTRGTTPAAYPFSVTPASAK